jgi:O-antigen/teichoic acid export membrane protein
MSAVKKNVIWNLSANLLPLVVGLLLFPKIISAYGLERFGLLSLIWALIGYFSLFDLGLSRALTQQISELIGKNRPKAEIGQLIRTAFIVMWALGIIGGLIIWCLSPLLIIKFLKIEGALQIECLQAFLLLAISIPIVVHTAALRAILEALNLFKSASIIRMVLGVGTFLAPFLASFISATLISAVAGLIFSRVMVWLLHMYAVKHSKILNMRSSFFNVVWLKPLLQFGGWMTVSNVIGPMMIYLDRFIIASLLGAAVTSFYVAPYEVVTKLLLIPVAIAGVLFPLFARQWQEDPAYSAAMLRQGICYTLALIFPGCILTTFFASEWLFIWLGQEFAEFGSPIVTWLTVGILANSVAQILYANVQGAKRSDWTAKLHLLELVPYFALLWICLNQWGMVGAAFAWCIRSVLDLIGLIFFCNKLNALNWPAIKNTIILLCFGSFALLISLVDLSLITRLSIVLALFFMYFPFVIKLLHIGKFFGWGKT